jgi:hypothetical protein
MKAACVLLISNVTPSELVLSLFAIVFYSNIIPSGFF